MQIKIPKVIEVGAHPYTIKYDDELVEEEGLLGKHEHKKLTITIYPNQLPTNKMTTFIHEHLHATSLVFCRDHGHGPRIGRGYDPTVHPVRY